MKRTEKALYKHRISLGMLAFFVVFSVFTVNANAEIGSALSEKLETVSDSDFVKIIISFENPNTVLNASPLAKDRSLTPLKRYSRMNNLLHEQADVNHNALDSVVQDLVDNGLIRDYETFWIAGMAHAEAMKDGVIVLNTHPAVRIINLDFEIASMEPVLVQDAPPSFTGAQLGIELIGARQAWEMGYDGTGSIVCNIDTGVDGMHPALMMKFRGNYAHPMDECWFDPYTNMPYPTDGRGHGTHTMGTILGSDGDDTIGVAPGAEWIAAAPVDRGGNLSRTLSDIILSFQWAADPDGNPETIDDRPDVINNSWGVPRGIRPECDNTFWDVIDNCEAMGVVVIFAAGNEGPNPQTLRTPADRATTPTNSFCVGAIDAADDNHLVATFSSRGPSGCDGFIIKPQVVGPGVGIRSSIPGGDYATWNGTSMATPHIAGAIAILRQVNQFASVDDIKYALMNTATDIGIEGPDFDYGYGLINIPAAIEYLINATDISDDDIVSIPDDIELVGNYPNPFNSSTSIKFRLNMETDVTLSVYNIAGEKVSTVFNGHLNAGEQIVEWDGIDNNGSTVSSGVYFYRLETDGKSLSRRMTLLK
ncbi:MAG: S8 family serine peptidase [candidate division Zixibacteria bacterium]|nr:S8 family serine peptidase [candidate division Zixibacteria bacterium]